MVEHRDKVIDVNYVNNKMESMLSAMFDTLGETEERLKNMEMEIFNLKKELRNGRETEAD
jgi:hypothetical protein